MSHSTQGGLLFLLLAALVLANAGGQVLLGPRHEDVAVQPGSSTGAVTALSGARALSCAWPPLP